MKNKKKSIELSKEDYKKCVAHLIYYFDTELDEPIGELKAGIFLDFILEQIGPSIYNQGIADMQTYMSERVEEMFAYMK